MRRFILLATAWLLMGQAVGTGTGVPFHSAWRAGGAAIPVFEFDPETTARGVAGLPTSITVGVTTVTPEIFCDAKDAGATWTCISGASTEDLTAQDDGTDPTYNFGTPSQGATDDAVKFNGSGNTGDYHQADTSTVGNVGTDDIVFEWTGHITADMMAAKETPSGAFPGWSISAGGTRITSFCIDDGPNVACPATATLDADTTYHILCTFNRNETTAAQSGACYVNGYIAGTPSNVSAVGDTDVATAMTLGARSGGTLNYAGAMSSFGIWHSPAWFSDGATGAAEAAALAQERSDIFWSIYAKSGTDKVGQFSRTSAGHLNKLGRLYRVGSQAPRVVDRTAGEELGYLSEPVGVNENLQSEDLGTSHQALDGGDAVGGSISNPRGETTVLAGIAGAAGGTIHGFQQSITLTAATWTVSSFWQAGDKSWAYMSDDTVANANAYIDLSDCSAGTVGSAATLQLETIGSWCRAAISFTGTAALHAIRYQCADADTDNTYIDGDGSTINCYSDFRQVELYPVMTSYIATTTAAATRTADVLAYNLTEGQFDAALSMHADHICPDGIHVGGPYLYNIADASGAVADGLHTYVSLVPADGVGYDGAAAGSDTTDITDGSTVYTVGLDYDGSEANLVIDGSIVDTDSSVTALSDTDVVQIGGYEPTGTLQPACIFTGARLYDTAGVSQ